MTDDDITRSWEQLSPGERQVAGEPADYDWESPVASEPPLARPVRTQFSMRIDADLHASLAELARVRGVTFSDIVREALETAAGRRQPVTGIGSYSFGQVVTVRSNIEDWVPTRGAVVEQTERVLTAA